MFGGKNEDYDTYNEKLSSKYDDESIKAAKVIGEYLNESEKIIWAGGQSNNKEIAKKYVLRSRLITAVGIILMSTIILTAFSALFVISTCAGLLLLILHLIFSDMPVNCHKDEFMAVTDRRVLVLIDEYFRQFELTNIKSTEYREISPGVGRVTLELFEYPFSHPNYEHVTHIYGSEEYERITPPLSFTLVSVKDPKAAKEAIDDAVMRVRRK